MKILLHDKNELLSLEGDFWKSNTPIRKHK